MFARSPITFMTILGFSLTAFGWSSAPSSAEKMVIVESVIVSGTQSLSSQEIAEITDSLAGGKFHDNSDELAERIRIKFSGRGYMMAKVEKLDIKVLDPVANPTPVRLEAVVSEGPLCHLSDVEFTGNHAIDSEKLRATIPLKKGQTFHQSSIASGLESMRSLYGGLGYLDITMIPNVEIDPSSSVKLKVDVDEGPQYRMGQFEVMGEDGAADNLLNRWGLAEGAVYDASYLEKFLEKNHSLLPADFTTNDVTRLTNCPDAIVSIHIHLKHDLQHEVADQAKQVRCEYKDDQTK